MCCHKRKLMLLGQLERPRCQRAGLCVFSKVKPHICGKDPGERHVVLVVPVHGRHHLGDSLAGDIEAPDHPCIQTCIAKACHRSAGKLLEDRVVKKRDSGREMLLDSGEVAKAAARLQLGRVRAREAGGTALALAQVEQLVGKYDSGG